MDMVTNSSTPRAVLDRLAIGLSALCGLHCVMTTLLIGMFAAAGSALTSPLVHEAGLALAIILGAAALGTGAYRHGRRGPLALGIVGLAVMATGLFLPHGLHETIATICGVGILGTAHILNMRATTHHAH